MFTRLFSRRKSLFVLLFLVSIFAAESTAVAWPKLYLLKKKRSDGGGIICETRGSGCIVITYGPVGDPKWEVPDDQFTAGPAGTRRVVLDKGNVEITITGGDEEEFEVVQ